MGVSNLNSIKNPGYFVFLNAKIVHFANASSNMSVVSVVQNRLLRMVKDHARNPWKILLNQDDVGGLTYTQTSPWEFLRHH